MMMDPPMISTALNPTNISAKANGPHARSPSSRVRPWSAADSDKCECVLEVFPHDVLLGRGSGPNDHVGNIKFRDLIHERKSEYLSTNHRQTKASIAKEIVDQIYGRGGRFLKKLGQVEAAKILPKLLAENGLDDPEADDNEVHDVYRIQKHAVVMEKAKQALRQNQRSGRSPSPTSRSPCHDASPITSRRRSHSRSLRDKTSLDSPTYVTSSNSRSSSGVTNFSNWAGISTSNMGIPSALNAFPLSEGFRSQNMFHRNEGNSNPAAQSYDITTSIFPATQERQSKSEEFQRHHDFQENQVNGPMMSLRQHQQELLMQYERLSQYQPRQLQHQKQMIQEQLENELRQQQLRQLQQQSMQKLACNSGLHSSKQQPPEFLNGYATYTTTLDAIEGNRQDAHRHDNSIALGEDEEIVDINDKANDNQSMQMSTMMGSFKDMSVRSNESMHNSNDTIGTIDNIPSGVVGGFSMAHMSGISIMSMMNDSTDSLFKSSSRTKDIGAHNASWGAPADSKRIIAQSAAVTASLGLPRQHVCGNSVKTSIRRSAAAAAGAAALGKNNFGTRSNNMDRRFSNTSNTSSASQSSSNDTNTAASAMIAMASVSEGGNDGIGRLQQHHASTIPFNNDMTSSARNTLPIPELMMSNTGFVDCSSGNNDLMGSWQNSDCDMNRNSGNTVKQTVGNKKQDQQDGLSYNVRQYSNR